MAAVYIGLRLERAVKRRLPAKDVAMGGYRRTATVVVVVSAVDVRLCRAPSTEWWRSRTLRFS